VQFGILVWFSCRQLTRCACARAGEWLCCPCKAYEDERGAAGVPQAQIRPPRWATVGDGGSPAGALKLEGGSRSVPCALCPISLGAFKQSTDGPWVHLVRLPTADCHSLHVHAVQHRQ